MANAATDATRRSGIISRPAPIVSSSSGETPGTRSVSFLRSPYTGGLPTSRVQSVAARPKTSLRGETTPPAKTSGAMNLGVPMPTVPWSSSAISVAMPKSTSTMPSSPRMRFWGFTSRCTICWSCTYWSASQAWRTHSIDCSTGIPPAPAP